MISHHRPCGRWCFARLIRQAETLELQLHSQPPSKRTALSPPKRSCFRFASLALRWAHRTSSSSCSGVPHGLFMISHHRPCGRWCFARLIRQAETLELQLHSQPPSKRTALSPPKRSCFRFASLALRLRTEPALRAAPVFRSAFFRKGHAMAFSLKRSTFRFASLTLRWAGEAPLPPAPLSPAPGNAETDRRQSPSAGKALFRSTPWISLPLCVSPGGLVLPAHAAPTGGKTCSRHSRRNTLAAPGLFLLSYRSFFFSYFS